VITAQGNIYQETLIKHVLELIMAKMLQCVWPVVWVCISKKLNLYHWLAATTCWVLILVRQMSGLQNIF